MHGLFLIFSGISFLYIYEIYGAQSLNATRRTNALLEKKSKCRNWMESAEPFASSSSDFIQWPCEYPPLYRTKNDTDDIAVDVLRKAYECSRGESCE
jgi:hypothetical protein